MAEHSSVVGGSSAERRINCPGSLQMEAKLPVRVWVDEDGNEHVIKESSSYADEGTALHSCMAYILTNNVQDLDEVLGMEFDGYVMTKEMIDDAIAPCVDFFDALIDELEAEPNAGEVEFLVECKVEMPGIPGAFGTCDVIARTKVRTVVVDWKFGVGVLVKAEYEDAERSTEDTIFVKPNAQVMFYARAGAHSLPHMFEKQSMRLVDLWIVQPRYRDGPSITSHKTTMKLLEDFRRELVAAIAQAQGESPMVRRGHWCRFAACKTICPHFTGPALDLTKMHAALEQQKMRASVTAEISIDWAEAYKELLTLAEMAEWIIGAIRSQAHAFMEDGNSIEGWKLVAKRATEKYADEAGAKAMALSTGIAEVAITTAPELLSPAKLGEALAPFMAGGTKKERNAAARAKIAEFTTKVSSGTTLAPADDKRQSIVPVSTQLMQLSDKLKALSNG